MSEQAGEIRAWLAARTAGELAWLHLLDRFATPRVRRLIREEMRRRAADDLTGRRNPVPSRKT